MSITLFTVFHFILGSFLNQSDEYFPNKSKVLTTEFNKSENFFPIATLDLTSKGIKDKIHVIFVCFDPAIDHYVPFPEGDYIDNYSFEITNDGLYNPTFNKTALDIGNRYLKYFVEGKSKFNDSKSESTSSLIRFYERPMWLQSNDTPKNSKGENMKFICQMEVYKVFNDDCWLYVFYDEMDRKVEYVLQRD